MNLKNKGSNWGIMTESVPQGSVLGLLLFPFYVNDLTKMTLNTNVNSNTQIVLFADDTSDCQ